MSRSRPGTQGSAKKWAAPTSTGPVPQSTSLATVACRLNAPLYISDRALPPENETVAIIQDWLRIPGTTTSGYDGDGNTQPDELDTYFTANNISQSPTCKWWPVPGPVFDSKSQLAPILQGAIPNAWFLSALGAVAMKRNLVVDLFPEINNEGTPGQFTVQLYKHGYWQQVAVSADFPCSLADNRLLVSSSSSPEGELWVSLVEKAYAKLHGGYASLEAGSIGDVLVDLTGGVVTKVNMEAQDEQDPGQLWTQLATWYQEGCVLVCMARWKAQQAPEGTAVLPNIGYCISSTNITNGTQMLQLTLPVVLQKSDMFKQRHAHEGCSFWMSYRDFLGSFNRIWAAQMYPAKWHQLTLHCGFHGPTAGGPYQLPSGAASSTWCCNPQFRLSVRKPCTVVLSLGQRDPQVVYGGHVKRREREEQHGMSVMRVGRDAASRQWEMAEGDVVAETGSSGAREVGASIQAEPSCSYVVVPYNNRAGQEGPFILRMFSSSALEVEQLPSPFSLVLGGNWTPATAGGSWQQPSWGSNPQFMLTVQHQCQVVVSLCRSDIKYALAKPYLEDNLAIGFALVHPESGPQGLLGRRTAVRNPAADMYHDASAPADEECTLLTTLQPQVPYILVPYTAEPCVEAPFELRVISATPVELVPLPDSPTVTLHGQWTEDTAGGCNLNASWRHNPKYLLTVQHKNKCRIHLTSMQAWKRNKPLDDMIGFYILRCSDEKGSIAGDFKSAVLVESPFVPMGDNSAEYEFQPGMSYMVMPCTYSAGKVGKFAITVAGAEPGIRFAQLGST